MKRYLLLVMVPALLLAMINVAFAGVQAGTFSVSPFVGGYTFLGAEHLETGPAFGIRGGYNFTDHVGIEAVYDFIKSENSFNEDDVNVHNYHLDLLYHFMPEGPLVPYVAAGYGGITRDYEKSGPFGPGTRGRGAFNYGAGLKYFLKDNMALRGDFRHLVMNENGTVHNLEYTVGLDFLFGGARPAATAAAAAAPVPAPAAEAPVQAPVPPPQPAEVTSGHYKYCVTLHIEFDIDRALIRPEYHDEVAKVGDFMKKYPSTSAIIEGHSDNVGDPQYNMQLSQRRAESVVDYLVEKFGIDRSRLTARGYGMTRPVASNATDEGKQQNRRIEANIDCAFDVKEITPPERLCIGLKIDFDTNKTDIKPEYRDEIAKVADYMKRYPTTTALIEGHTDNVGSVEYNMKLSRERAESVVNYLVDNFGIERSRLSAKGYGFSRRIAYDDTEEGRAKNRRINAVIDCVTKK